MLSLAQAKKLALLSQGLPPKRETNAQQALERLGYVQIDTISVIQRAHHHVLWSRSPGYHPQQLDELVAQKKAFEYWSHAASYLPMRDFRFSLRRKEAIKSGEQKHWFTKNPKLMNEVLKRIEAEGPLMAKDFESKRNIKEVWGSKPTKQALECLYMQGDLMISQRQSFHKVYDLTERVLPASIDTSTPTAIEQARFLITSYLNAHGLGSLPQFVYLLKSVKTDVKLALSELVEDKVITPLTLSGEAYFVLNKSLELLNQRLNRRQAKILSPFDNLLIQRKRAKQLFGFDYLLECYVPEAKRKFGYFCLPIMWDGELVAMADCKVNKRESNLEVINLFIEPKLKQKDDFMQALEIELTAFATFNQCSGYTIQAIKTKKAQ